MSRKVININMLKYFLSLTITALLITTNVPAADISNCNAKNEKAEKLLIARINKDKLYDSRITKNCYSYHSINCSSNLVEIELNEVHNARCGGEPLVSPVLDRYKVHIKSNRIEWYYAPTGEYVPYSKKRISSE